MKFPWNALITFIFVVLLITIQLGYWLTPITLSDILSLHDQLIVFVQSHPVTAVLSYIGLYTISIVFGIPLSITIIGGYLFGIEAGLFYSLISIALGTAILCSLVRYAIGSWIQKRYQKQLDPLNKELKKYGLNYILIIHAIPFMPSFLPNIATGISNIPLTHVFSINILGALPLSLIYVIAGSYLHIIDSAQTAFYYLIILGTILGLLFLSTLLIRRFVLT